MPALGKLVGAVQFGLYRSALKIKPNNEYKLNRHLKFSWTELHDRARKIDYIGSFLLLGVVFVVSYWLSENPILRLSVLTACTKLVEALINHIFESKIYLEPLLNILGIGALIVWRKDVASIYGLGAGLWKGLPGFAWREELIFRAGAQRWTKIEKFRACVSFGLAHFSMLIVPLGAAIALSIAGIAFMAIYLGELKKTQSEQQAVYRAATVHTVYNIVVLGTMAVFLVALNILLVASLFGLVRL